MNANRRNDRSGFQVQHVSMTYEGQNGAVQALENVSFQGRDQEFLCIVGPSGCGKTTLLKLLAGLLQPTSGRIVFDDEYPSRFRTALVFQEHGLFPWMSVLENVAFGLEMQGVRRGERWERALDFIRKVGLAAFADTYPAELSVGMQQRVGIARAFVANPAILIMDEPFGSLDAQTKLVLQQELLRIWKEDQKSVVFVTHDIDEALLLGNRVLVLSGRPGRILEEFAIPNGRPRTPADRTELEGIRWHIWTLLEQEVKKSLAMQA
jgi:NitT/TauT family transport system ATP-binding protein